jgi:chromosome segregation ATPase
MKSQSISEKESLNESLSLKDKEITRLSSEKSEVEKEIKQLKENLESSQSKLKKQNSLVEQYKDFAHQAANRYIESKSVMLGIDVKDIKSRLPKDGYDMDDVDRVCDSLQEGFKSVNKLPFNLNNGKVKKVVMTESKNDSLKIPVNSGDEIDDSLLMLAGIK